MKEYVVKYSLEFVVIFLGILISLYFEDARQDRVENERKNKSIEQLINVIDQDINQINNFIKLQEVSLESSDILYDNLNNEINLSEEKIMYNISSVGRALKSFFPQEGIFNQLIATGSFELIEKDELKSLLLEIYNHQNNRNYATSYQIDLFQIKFSESIYNNFRVNSEYNYKEGEIYGKPVVKSFSFNENYYYSNEFYGLLAEGKVNGNNYLRLIDNIRENYVQAKIYAEYEISN